MIHCRIKIQLPINKIYSPKLRPHGQYQKLRKRSRYFDFYLPGLEIWQQAFALKALLTLAENSKISLKKI